MIEIWIEGYITTGDTGKAYKLLDSEIGDFNSAVEEELLTSLDKNTDGTIRKPYSIWGCRLFDNEVDARKSFG